MAKDIVCGMYVDETKTPFKVTRRGRTYYFCSKTCQDTFLQPERELRSLKILTAFSLTLGFIIVFLDHIYTMLLGTYAILGVKMNIILFLLATPVQFIAGYRFYRGTLDAVKARQANMDSLIAVGTSAAWVYSTLVTFYPEFFKQDVVYFMESSLIIGLILLGRTLEHLVKNRASEAVEKLLDLQPSVARVLKEGTEVEMPAEKVETGYLMLVKVGEKMPVDGVVIDGFSYVDQSMVTGESIPVEKKAGDEVIGGTVNKSGVLRIKATRVGEDTVLSQIVRLVEEAVLTRSKLQRLADRVASYFVPIVIGVSIFAFAYWYYIAALPVYMALSILISIMIIACPCALGIATPAAITMGAGKGARLGILIKGGEQLEKIHKVDTIVFDKTGTLTVGEPRVTDVIGISMNREELLRLAASVEQFSEHPLAEAIVKASNLDLKEPGNFEVLPGMGVRASVDGRVVLIGNEVLMKSEGVGIDEGKLGKLQEEGKTVVMVAFDGRLAGLIGLMDAPKEDALGAIRRLKKMELKVIMLTGDNRRTAEAIAKKLEIGEVIPEVMPQDKARVVQDLRKQGRTVAMVGDGINDAPALAAADVGVAIGSGTDIAKETGGIVLMNDKLPNVVNAIELGRETVSKIRQNLFWAFIYNVALIPVAAGILYPLLLNPIIAAAAMALSSISVTFNSILLGRWRPKVE